VIRLSAPYSGKSPKKSGKPPKTRFAPTAKVAAAGAVLPGPSYLALPEPEQRAVIRLWPKFGARVESKRVDVFANMSDEELRQYVYGKELDSSARRRMSAPKWPPHM
jgi:hypothetical protein